MRPASAQDESGLVTAARTDIEAFARLYDRYVQPVYRYCYRSTSNVHDAEDLTSQTFLAALEALPRYRWDGQFAAWLFSIAHNKVADHHRRKPDAALAESMAPFDPDPGGSVETSQQKQILLHAVRQLTHDERELIHLRYVSQLSFREIAKVLHKSEEATKKMLYRLLARLRSQMEAGDE